ncbi:DNA-binding winged helix-turn-helix (wHTH) protein/tetratricopeptide (TPR) repeat protein [Dokdonella fugitiva]|uniref:DNA-binding winged helix-turn-helix (WHTH) protein/tetratricopeptide (TPR) repeat protein n=1 Tax=Dokdonella fugitiva TaxID=328517 RepID=A0A839F6B8_9GAMM|nr:winged helix-turn-helix domain-containing protein [Dokdonella fugitiva]MBA8889612.1 DNA-binding winged helix-turn-helix (wHTH) protein/tetratricopeptide (TPR) repeat protein [Dokdonella fugitiva]
MSARHYRFGGFELDASSRTLRDAHGPVALPLKSFDCLVYLIEQRERAVGRDELISAVWGRADVSDALLGQTLARARRAIGDTGDEQRFIRTVARFGYHWVAPVVVVEQVAPPAPEPAIADTARALPALPGEMRTPSTARRRRVVPVGVAVAFALATAALLVWWRMPPAMPEVASAGAALVLPVDVPDDGGDARWIRFGAMDYLASRLRERSGRPVLPSEQVIAYLARDGEAAVDPARRRALALAAGASLVLAARMHREAHGWTVELDVEDSERNVRHAATAPTPLQAIDRALADWLGDPAIAETPARPTALELQQRIDAAFLEGDLREAAAIAEAAPADLQRLPEIAVRVAEVDERSGRMEQAQRDFERLASAPDVSPLVHARSLYGLCAVAFRRNEPERAQAHCRAALAALDGRHEPLLLGRAYMMRGVIEDQLGRYEDALSSFARARIEWQAAGNLPGEASLDVNEGLAHAHHGRFAEAVASFQRGAAVFERFGVIDHLASTLAAKSDAQRMMLDSDDALASSTKAWRLAPRMDDPRAVLAIAYTHAQALLANARLDELGRLVERYDDGTPVAPPEFALMRLARDLARGVVAPLSVGDVDRLVDRVLAPPDPSSDARLSRTVDLLVAAALAQGRRDVAAHALQRLHDAGETPLDADRPFVAAFASARLAAADGDAAAADAGYARAFDLALAASRADEWVPAGAARVAALVRGGRLDAARGVGGRLAAYADRDLDAAEALLALYDAGGETAAAARLRERIEVLRGQRLAAEHAP